METTTKPVGRPKQRPQRIEVGDTVKHKIYGVGGALRQWGSILDDDERGKSFNVNASNVFDVLFEGRIFPISVDSCRLHLVRKGVAK